MLRPRRLPAALGPSPAGSSALTPGAAGGDPSLAPGLLFLLVPVSVL